jgi:hypothetical protein
MDYLQHFNTHKGIEGLLKLGRDLSVVEKMDSNTTHETCLADSFFGENLLFHRQG